MHFYPIIGSSSITYTYSWSILGYSIVFTHASSTSFCDLREDSEFFDVTLCCDNGRDTLPAHKLILAACSPLFRSILAHQKCQQNPFLYLKGINLRELQAVLDFVYYGEVNVAKVNFLTGASQLL